MLIKSYKVKIIVVNHLTMWGNISNTLNKHFKTSFNDFCRKFLIILYFLLVKSIRILILFYKRNFNFVEENISFYKGNLGNRDKKIFKKFKIKNI